MTSMRWRATRLALAWSLGSVAVALIGVALCLLVVDLLLYDGHCPGSLLPFIGDPQPRTCGFTEYLDGHGLFTLQEVRCIGACGLAPVMMIDEEVYGKLDRKKIEETLELYRNA